MTRKSKNVLVMFARDPVPGECKTRLTPHLNEDQSANLYKAFIRDLLDKLKGSEYYDFYVYLYHSNIVDSFWATFEVELRPQQGENLGERMLNAFAELFNEGYEKAVIIGSDVPTIDIADIGEAFKALETDGIVLGPAEDGGYYLIGLKHAYQQLFEDIDWGSSGVYSSTLSRIKELSINLYELKLRNDVDTIDDLRRLIDDIGRMTRAARENIPETVRIINKIPFFEGELNKSGEK
ncbi:MAG: DUF2064 domain-containing protein [candidate division Zixibacteria bacterium]|nr:DUF2064 domain-containing protein [candidate division Zixibacteria bacterium]